MIRRWLREPGKYFAILSMVPKVFMAYQLWFWIGLVLSTIGMAILYFFWRAVYGTTAEIAGLTLNTTLTYILLAQVFRPLTDVDLIFEFGYNLREGGIVHALLRPINFQAMYYAQNIGELGTGLIMQIPMALVATFVFGLKWPADPTVWGAFVVSALLGYTSLYFFIYCVACLTFYTTEAWGLSVLIYGMALFLSGGLVPLSMMPVWLQTVVLSIPFSQALAVPINILTGITPLSEVPHIWLTQVIWVLGLWLASNLIFRVAIRKVTVQGG
jgi:ABC-2 type transport system permease protein